MKKVSIIMSMYNMEAFICDAIESVIAQTYTNWELLITDDCSTDHSVEKVKEYAEKDDRIKLFSTHHNTGGPSEPRNISLSQATGELLFSIVMICGCLVSYKNRLILWKRTVTLSFIRM